MHTHTAHTHTHNVIVRKPKNTGALTFENAGQRHKYMLYTHTICVHQNYQGPDVPASAISTCYIHIIYVYTKIPGP